MVEQGQNRNPFNGISGSKDSGILGEAARRFAHGQEKTQELILAENINKVALDRNIPKAGTVVRLDGPPCEFRKIDAMAREVIKDRTLAGSGLEGIDIIREEVTVIET